MKHMTTSTHLRLAVAAVAAVLLAACASAPATGTATEAPAEKVYQFEPWEGDGMEIPLDGSSLEAFDTSMARVKAYTTPANYTTLENSIEYLLIYDLSVRRDKAKLAEKLDGKTPYQVIEMIQWRKPAPGKSKAEKGAADATIEL